MSIRLFRRYKTVNVFTPSSIAKLTYVNRDVLENDVEKFIKIPGMQIILYGYSGCGKSTLITNKLDKLKVHSIRTCCESRTSFQDILLQAFDQLNPFYTSEYCKKDSATVTNKMIVEYAALKAELTGSATHEESGKLIRLLPPQFTPQRLAEYLGKVECVWIIEDFHKVAVEEKKKIADMLKVFMDLSSEYPKVKIVCIGAVATARELIELESNLSTRVAEIFVPLLSDKELNSIIRTGFRLLNIAYSEDIANKIIHYSNQLAAVCHQICYDICCDLKISKTPIFGKDLTEDNFAKAVAAYVRKNSDTMLKIFDRISSSGIRKNVLSGFIALQRESASLNNIVAEVLKRNKHPAENIEKALLEMTTNALGEVFRFDTNSSQYSIANPFYHAFAKMKLALEKQENDDRARKKTKNFDIRQTISGPFIFNEQMLLQMMADIKSTYRVRIINTEPPRKQHGKFSRR